MSDGRFLPRTTALPTRTGTVTVGQTQTGTNATFTGSGTVTVTRAWVRDNAEISGQTAATYVLAAADQGKRVRFRNKASNLMGTTIYDSLPTGIVP
jgi:copper(I)-binding protein